MGIVNRNDSSLETSVRAAALEYVEKLELHVGRRIPEPMRGQLIRELTDAGMNATRLANAFGGQ